jgi:hypothetical protein
MSAYPTHCPKPGSPAGAHAGAVDPVDARDRAILDREGECSFGVEQFSIVKASAASGSRSRASTRAARIAPMRDGDDVAPGIGRSRSTVGGAGGSYATRRFCPPSRWFPADAAPSRNHPTAGFRLISSATTPAAAGQRRETTPNPLVVLRLGRCLTRPSAAGVSGDWGSAGNASSRSGTESSQTLCWREKDSNPRSRVRERFSRLPRLSSPSRWVARGPRLRISIPPPPSMAEGILSRSSSFTPIGRPPICDWPRKRNCDA